MYCMKHKLKVRISQKGLEKKAFPRNLLALRFCQLVKREYLTQEEIYIIQKIGMVVEIEKENP